MSEVILIILLSGVGTFLLRFLPIWQARRKAAGTASTSARLRAFLQGVGPAAMTALLVVSLWPMLQANTHAAQSLVTLIALTVITLTKRWLSGIALPTLTGALTYGFLMHLLG